jgi:predicted glycosyltransferase
VRVWVDLTNAPHVPVLAPLIEVMRTRGMEVLVTARPYGQTVELAALHGLDCEPIGAHGGRGRLGKGRAAGDRVGGLLRWARGRAIDVGLAHGSTDQPVVARLLRFPAVTMFDYEGARLQHGLNCRLARRVLVPDAIPVDAVIAHGARPDAIVRYPGLKEEYALHDFVADPTVRPALGVRDDALLAVLRPPPSLALYHEGADPLFEQVMRRLAEDETVDQVVLPRTDEQGAAIAALGLPNLIIPGAAIDARSLIAGADLVVSAGGTMNREAVVLGVPVWSTFSGTLGAVDRRLIEEGRLRRLERVEDLVVARRGDGATAAPTLRDPALLVDLALAGLGR